MSDVKVTREPLTYERGGPNSFFRDLVDAPDHLDAHRRLREHKNEQRADAGVTPGEGGYFAPPGWLVQDYAEGVRPERVVTSLLNQVDLPQGVSSINIPRFSNTATVASTENSGIGNYQPTDAASSGTVKALSGSVLASYQLLEQSPVGAHFDAIVYNELQNAYDAKVETEVLLGTTGLVGYAGVAGTKAITGSATTGVAFIKEVAEGVAYIGANRFRPAEAIVMSSSRWAWLASQEFEKNTILALTSEKIGVRPYVGSIGGFPVVLSDALRFTAPATESAFIVRPKDGYIFESGPRFTVNYDQAGSAHAEVELVYHRNVAINLGRYPTGIAKITGLAIPTGF